MNPTAFLSNLKEEIRKLREDINAKNQLLENKLTLYDNLDKFDPEQLEIVYNAIIAQHIPNNDENNSFLKEEYTNNYSISHHESDIRGDSEFIINYLTNYGPKHNSEILVAYAKSVGVHPEEITNNFRNILSRLKKAGIITAEPIGGGRRNGSTYFLTGKQSN